MPGLAIQQPPAPITAKQPKTSIRPGWTTIPKEEHDALKNELAKLRHSMTTLANAGYPFTGRSTSTATTTTITAEPKKRFAVALDCEMAEVTGKKSAVVQLCAVDVLTGEILLDKAVDPEERVTNWRTRWSGMTPRTMQERRRRGEVVKGTPAAVSALLDFVDENTILVGHALHHDLRALGIVHTRVIDTALVTRDAVSVFCNRTWKLKLLCGTLCGKQIQMSSGGHDCVEDTYATREVLLECVRNEDKLRDWAADMADDLGLSGFGYVVQTAGDGEYVDPESFL